ncbi:MAG: DUF885 family protein, partial [Chloroflexota bacterium]|nr:DUF885 family protein [Chloroflexota bacterium]
MTHPGVPDPRRPGPQDRDPDAAARLAELAVDAWDRTMAAQPEYATALGDRRFDGRLRPNDADALARDRERIESLQGRAAAIDPVRLSADDRVTHAALLDYLGTEHDLTAAGIEAWAVDPLDGPQVQFLNIPSFQPVASEADGTA